MSGSPVRLERRPDGVALLSLDRPKMNAISGEVLSRLEAAAEDLRSDPPGAVVVWGGRRIFAAGADIAEFEGPEKAASLAASFHSALDALASIPRATIAAINGYALGGGCEVALACDFRFAAEDAKLGQPEVGLGIIPGGGGTQRLARLVGPARAKDLVLSGRQVTAKEALSMGLVDRVFEPDGVIDAAIEAGGRLAAGAVVAQGLAKRAIDDGLASGSLARGMAIERELFAASFRTEDARIGISSFLEEGPGRARFRGR
jgi:enoyl-CoA hydratase/carnithine racemase